MRQAHKIVRVILGNSDHPSLEVRLAFMHLLRKLLAQVFAYSLLRPQVRLKVDRSLVDFLDRDLWDTRLVVMFFHEPWTEPTPLQVQNLRSYLETGGQILCVHSPTASCKKNPDFTALLGGTFLGHGPIGTFRVSRVSGAPGASLPNHPLEPFDLTDELYTHRLEPGIQVEYTGSSDQGTHALAWVHRVGDGRVYYFSPGHLVPTFRSRRVRILLRRALSSLVS
ncbi:MAG: ThuA domain-containing protein [Spirochaetales bacterium]|nr:ThuA domain-containing protein [Spirochaetales bacterium]